MSKCQILCALYQSKPGILLRNKKLLKSFTKVKHVLTCRYIKYEFAISSFRQKTSSYRWFSFALFVSSSWQISPDCYWMCTKCFTVMQLLRVATDFFLLYGSFAQLLSIIFYLWWTALWILLCIVTSTTASGII